MRFSYLKILSVILLVISCEEITEFNPLDPDPENQDFIEPETTITSAPETVTTTSAVITWSGNKADMEFRHRLNSQEWSSWSSDTSVILNSLVEDEYTFYVQGRYLTGTQDNTPAVTSFIVDYIRPTTNITSGPTNDSTVDTSMVRFTWEIESGSEYSYILLNNSYWSDWSTDSTVTYNKLTEDIYTFKIKSRYDPLIEEAIPTTVIFTIDYTRPITNIISGPSDGSTIDISTVTFTWEIETGVEYSYNLNNSSWSDWSTDYSVTLDYLDEGEYSFIVKSRYDPLIEEEEPGTINFVVDAIEGPLLRAYPLKSNINTMQISYIEIFVEEVTDLALAEFQVIYDQSLINIATIENGSMIGENISDSAGPLLISEDNSGTITINFAILGDSGLSGSGAIVRFKLIGKATGSFTMQIVNPIFRDINNNDISIFESVNGLVVVE